MNRKNYKFNLENTFETVTAFIKLTILVAVIYVIYKFYMKYFGCSKSVNDGESCEKNCDCKNGACGRKDASDNASLGCCNSGKTHTYAGFDYCGDIPDGSVCWSNEMCSSGYCRDNGGGTRKGICGKGDVGNQCGINSDCKNGACGRQTAADGAPLGCCKSGKTTMYGGFDYCADMPDGSVCWADSMCQSGTCEGNAGGFQKGVCKKKSDVNQSCSSNGDCKNGACARGTADDNAQKICCSSGQFDTYGGYDYCKGMSSGSVCWSDAMCSSGNCSGNWGGLKKGHCS